jgi:hypothetical protein
MRDRFHKTNHRVGKALSNSLRTGKKAGNANFLRPFPAPAPGQFDLIRRNRNLHGVVNGAAITRRQPATCPVCREVSAVGLFRRNVAARTTGFVLQN